MKEPAPTPRNDIIAGAKTLRTKYWTATLVFSLLLNLVLLFQLRPDQPGLATEERQPPPLATELKTRKSALITGPAEWHWSDRLALDFRTLRSRLLAAGCPEHTVHAILETVINARYLPQLTDLYGKSQPDFWEQLAVIKTGRKLAKTVEQKKGEQSFNLLLKERAELLKELAGPGSDHGGPRPSRDDDQEDPRVSFLPTEKRHRIEEQQNAVTDLRQHLKALGADDKEIENQVKALRSLHDSELTEFLTQAEIEEYRLRRSPYNHLMQNQYSFESSHQERVAIVRLYEEFEGKVPDAALEEALGRERSIQFRRSGDGGYESMHRVGRHLNLTEDKINQAFELKQGAEARAQEIRNRRDLDRKQKAGLLRNLEQEARANLAGQFGPDGGELYLKNGGWWIQALGKLEK